MTSCSGCRGQRWTLGLMVAIASLAGFGFRCAGAGAAEPLQIGAKSFTESVVLAEILARLVENTGRETDVRQLGGTTVVWQALVNGEIDAYVDYTGTLQEEIFSGRAVAGPVQLRAALAEAGVGMSEPIGFNNTYAIGVSPDFARAHPSVDSISDLRSVDGLRLGFSNEFMQRSDGWPSLSLEYGIPPELASGLAHALAYRGLASGSLDAIDVYTTDAQIEHHSIKVLEDDLAFFPNYEAVLLYRLSLRETDPSALAAMLAVEGAISEVQMRRLNARAMIDRVAEPVVAADFVAAKWEQTSEVQLEARLSRLWRYTRQHALLVGVSVLMAIALAVPLGVAAAKLHRTGQAILALVGVLQTIPSLVMFVMLIPVLGIGPRPAIMALFLYSLLPIVRNTYAGLHDIPPSLRESSIAIGLPAWARLRRIELPLAARSILAGVKTAAVINVGTATLGGLINAGGYGDPIFTGIRLDRQDLLLEGAIPAALMALLLQAAFEWVERRCVSPGLGR